MTKMVRNTASFEGHELGKVIAYMCDQAEPEAKRLMPDLRERCASCAFRQGKHLPNGSVSTLGDALKCAMEGIEFRCHEPDEAGEVATRYCAGWKILQLVSPERVKAPWGFSDDGPS